jgi:hypothetical protein
MAELVVLSLNRAELDATHKRARQGDEEAVQVFEQLWDDYADRSLACFLCDKEIERPVFTMLLPERADKTKAIAAPLCHACRDLPKMIRLNRAITLLRKMWSRGGKQMHFTFKPTRRR